MTHLNNQYQKCIDACNDCTQSCLTCATTNIRPSEQHHHQHGPSEIMDMSKCILLCLDCADMCKLAVSVMSRTSENAKLICLTCAKICDICAVECESHEDMEQCIECGKVCRSCAEECRKMSL